MGKKTDPKSALLLFIHAEPLTHYSNIYLGKVLNVGCCCVLGLDLCL